VARAHIEPVSVRYAETDRMGVAHHSSYLLWFELARTGLLREAGHAYRTLEESGVRLPVIEYGCRFLKSADYDDALRIETRVRDLRSRMVTFDYVVRRGDDVLAEGFTHHVCVDDNHRPRRLPDAVMRALAEFVPSSSA
jgi:acyl-CoA thioester hydrolase